MRMTKPSPIPTRSASPEPRCPDSVFVTEVPMTARAPGTRESVTRSKEHREKLVDVVQVPQTDGNMFQREVVNGELLNFKFWGHLRESRTEVKNTLPTFKTIEKEKLAIEFEQQRRSNPDGVVYKDFFKQFYEEKYS